jgi:hypothetical protein
MLAIRPALTSWMDAIRRAATSTPVAAADAKIRRFEQPVPKVTRMPRSRDGFDDSNPQQSSANPRFNNAQQEYPRFGSNSRSATAQPQAQASAHSATAQPRGGATDVTRYLRHDGFESATRKPVELTPKPPPSFKPAIPVFRFR